MISQGLKSKVDASSVATHEQRQRPLVLVASGVFLGFLLLATAGYYFIEGDYTWLESLYMTVITVATVGYHVVGKAELSDAGKVWTIFVIAGGLGSGAVAREILSRVVDDGFAITRPFP